MLTSIFNQNIKHYLPRLYARRLLGYFPCVLTSVFMTVECNVFCPAPKHMIRLSVDYRHDSKIPIRL